MRRYESYKDSGVEWLGEIPSHWECLPIRSIFKFRNEKNDPIKTDNILSLSIANGVTEYSDENRGGNKRKDDLSSYKLAYPNDIVLNSMNVIVGAVGVSKYFGAISPVYYALSLYNQRANLSYYENIFKNENFQRGLLRFGKGILIKFGENGKMNTIRMKISQDDLKKLYFPIPPLDEQQKIAQFLDDKTAKIDQAVALAEKQIALLKEHKQILIQNAVTRGLNPDVPLKDSSVEWIGQVPEHWDVKKLKFVSKINQHTLPENTNGRLSIKYVDIGSVSFENGIEKVENFLFKNAPSRARRLANRGDIVVSTVRTYLKAITMVKEEHQDCIFSTGFAVITSNECLEDNFFELYAKSDAFTEQVSVFSKGMSYPAINSTDLSNLWITVPPLSEQQKIADYLETQVSKINQAITLKTAHIEKLKEYKSVLINDVVTGKVRV